MTLQLPDWTNADGVDAADYSQTAASPLWGPTQNFTYTIQGVSYRSNVALLFQVRAPLLPHAPERQVDHMRSSRL